MPIISEKKSLTFASLVIAVGIIIAAGVHGGALYYSRTTDDTLAVTGSAKQTVTADIVKWTAEWTRTAPYKNLKMEYALMRQDEEAVRLFLDSNKIVKEAVKISPIALEDNKYQSSSGQAPLEYTLRQRLEVNATDVVGITAIAKRVEDIVNLGIIFSTLSLEYFYSKLPELRVSLLEDAVKDAKARAKVIAKAGGVLLGNLSTASAGVVQVLPQNSIEVSDYGTYDTQSIEKDIMVTVKTIFTLQKK